MAKQKQKIYKENSLDEITVKKVSVCVCVCVSVCVCICLYVCLCVCVCVYFPSRAGS